MQRAIHSYKSASTQKYVSWAGRCRCADRTELSLKLLKFREDFAGHERKKHQTLTLTGKRQLGSIYLNEDK